MNGPPRTRATSARGRSLCLVAALTLVGSACSTGDRLPPRSFPSEGVSPSGSPSPEPTMAASPTATAPPEPTMAAPPTAMPSPEQTVPASPTPSSRPSVIVGGAGWKAIRNAPFMPGIGTSMVWTGTEVIAFGGMPSGGWDERDMTARGATLDPNTGRWRSIPPAPGPGRAMQAAVWTGNEVLVWGGRTPTGGGGDGAAYEPTSRRWRALAPSPLAGRENAVVAWTGSELFVWGGNESWKARSDGAAYDPGSNTWRRLPRAPIAGRWASAVAWTGIEVLVWGGVGEDHDWADGAAWNPVSNTWRRLARSPLAPRAAGGVWTGRELVVFGGSQEVPGEGEARMTDGAAYDPATDTWRRIRKPLPPPGATYGSGHIWTGTEMLVSGTRSGNPRWIAYDPAADTWRALPEAKIGLEGFPQYAHWSPDAVWTGTELILWGAVYDCWGDCTATVVGQAGVRLEF
jgi:hypothetical protein